MGARGSVYRSASPADGRWRVMGARGSVYRSASPADGGWRVMGARGSVYRSASPADGGWRVMGTRGSVSDAKLRIECVAEPVAEEVHAEGCQRQRRTRKGGEPPRDVEEVAALRQHRAPRRRGRLNAEAEEADRGLGHDELRELQAGH